MFSKPINLILVYIITIFNIVILFSPVFAAVAPFVKFQNHQLIIQYSIFQQLKFSFFILAFLVSFFMLFYFILDFIFGFSLRASLKGCVRYEKIKDYDFLSAIFDQVKEKFNVKTVKLYVKNSDEINAFAVSSLGGKAIVLTQGLINHYLVECEDPKKFLYAIRSVIGHEMSHLINKDFLPSFLIITNQKVTNFVSRILHIIFRFVQRGVAMMPYYGNSCARIMGTAYFFLNFALTAFNRFIVYNVYEFLRRFLSRVTEYRCDFQSAKAFGGAHMALALSMLSEGGYSTLFSTHPGTKSRIKRVENIKQSESIINPIFADSLANYFALMFLVVICLYFAKCAGVDLLVRDYIKNHELIHRKLSMLLRLISRSF